MDLQEQYDDIISWAKENDLLLVKAELNNGKTLQISFDYNEPDSIAVFKSIISKLYGKVIIYKNYLLTAEHYEECLALVRKMEDEERIEEFYKLKPYQNKILYFRFDFVKEGAVYRLERYIEEIAILRAIEDALEDGTEDEEDNSLPDDKALELGRQLASDENYTKAKNRLQKQTLAQKLFPEIAEYDYNPYYQVTMAAENIYEMEIKPLQEKQLMDNIKRLKKEGKNKVSICSELKISKHIIDKYY